MTDPKEGDLPGRGERAQLPTYPGLPSKTGKTSVIIVQRPKISQKPAEVPGEAPQPSRPDVKPDA